MSVTHTRYIPLSRPDIREEDISLVNDVLRSGMLVQHEYVLKLEKAFAAYHGARHAIAASNGTATLHLALKVLGITSGDEVIVPAFSYVATANAVELVGATPVFADVDPATFNINVAAAEAAITGRTKAIIPVHEFGLACRIEEVVAMAKKNGISVIEDAACSLGARQNQRLTGTFGIIGSFSLHPRKSITSGEGGMLLTNDDHLAMKLRQWRNHGIQMENGKMNFVEAGFNYRMTDFQAALAYGQFQRIDDILEEKNKRASLYFSTIKNKMVKLPSVPRGHNHTWQTFHVMLERPLAQGAVIEHLKQKGIGANYGAQCIPAQTFYRAKYNLDAATLFPNAYKAYTQGLAIPLYGTLPHDDILYIAETINEIC